MKKALLFILPLLLATACKEAPQYTISGNSGNANDTLYLFGLEKGHDKVEKIVCDDEGYFSHSVDATEELSLMLTMPDGELIPLYGEPGMQAELITDKNGERIVKGGREQALYDSIARILENFDSNSERVVHIDNFIKANPFSRTNIEVIRRFMVEVPNPNNNFIKKRINSLGGTLQDHEYFTELKTKLDGKNSNNIHKMLPAFEFITAEGEKVTSRNYRDKLLVINFWAAWDSVSRKVLKEQGRLYAQCDTSKTRILNISLDYDTAAWRKSLTADSIVGDNVCDRKVWNNELASKFSITSLPYTITVSPYQRIDLFGVDNERFVTTIDSLTNRYFNKKKK